MFSFLKKIFNSDTEDIYDSEYEPLHVDMHSHLIPGIDDGAKTPEESIRLIQGLKTLGYNRLITTPHITGDHYKNTPEIILARLDAIQKILSENKIEIKLTAAAEYFIDEWFLKKIQEGKLLSFGNEKFVLVETGFLNKPINFSQVITELKTAGYRPILAHPERYLYLYNDFNNYFRLRDTGILFQINLMSITGHYNRQAKKIVQKLIDARLVDMAGTDLHTEYHLSTLAKLVEYPYYKKLLGLPLLNNTI